MVAHGWLVLAVASASPPAVAIHLNPWRLASTVMLFDTETLAPIGSADIDGLAEPLHFDAASESLFVVAKPRKSKNATRLFRINTRSAEAELVGELGLASRQSFLDPSRTRLYVVGGNKKSKPNTISTCNLAARRPVEFLASVERLTALQLSPDGTRLFALCEGRRHRHPKGPSGNVHVLDARTGRELARLDAGRDPKSVAFDAGQGLVYVLGATDLRGEGTLTIVRDGEVADRLATPGIPSGLRIAPDGTPFILTSRAVVALNRDGLAAVRSWDLSFEPSDLIFDPDHDLMFAGAGTSSTIAEMRMSVGETLVEHPTGSAGRKFGKNVGAALYVLFAAAAAAGGAPVGGLPPVVSSTSMVLGESGTTLYVLNPNTNDVSIFDVAKRDVVDIVHVGGGCRRIVQLPGERDFWVEAGSRLARVNTTTNRIDRTVDFQGLVNHSVAYDPIRMRAWISMGAKILAVDLRTGEAVGHVELPKAVGTLWYEPPRR